jgi:hypothetical protein
MNIRYLGVVIVGVLLHPGASSQVVTGRSNTGTITLTAVDSALVVAGKRFQALSFEIEFSEPSGNKSLEAKETGRLRVVISNAGKTMVRGVVARVAPLTPPTGITYNDSIVVGDIPVNASRYAIFYFTAKDNVPSQIVTFQVELFVRGVEATEPKLLTFLTKDQRSND